MKKRVLNISLILLLTSTGSVFAQQGFGTNSPDKSAAVDIVSPNKGLLVPRLSLQSLTLTAPVNNPAKSLVVYNTNTDAALQLKEGFYYWEGTKWEAFTTSAYDQNTRNVTFEVVGNKLVLTDSDGQSLDVNISDINTDNQQIENFEIGTDHLVTLTLEDGGTKTIDLSPYFNSTKVEQGINTTLQGNGSATAPYKISVDKATDLSLGVVQIGSGITIDANGVISVPQAPGETITAFSNIVTGNKIADYENEAGVTQAINETVTSMVQSATGITYKDERGESVSAKVVSGNAGNLIQAGTDFGALLTADDIHTNQKTTTVKGTAPVSVTPSSPNASGNTEYTVSANMATAASVGVVKPGTGLAVDGTGTLSVNFPAAPDGSETKLVNGTNTTVSGTGTATDQYHVNVATATATTVGVVKPGTGLSVSTDGTLDVTVIDTNTDNQQLTYNTATKILTLERGGTPVDLSALATDTNSKTVVTAAASNVVVTPSVNTTTDTTTYSVEVKNAMPVFFYMPSILIDTSIVDPNTIKTVNLYQQYTSQFNVTNTAHRSTSAPAQIPVLPAATDLYYYITYHDAASIQIIGIDANGVMSYKVVGNTNSLSFVNIVFVIK